MPRGKAAYRKTSAKGASASARAKGKGKGKEKDKENDSQTLDDVGNTAQTSNPTSTTTTNLNSSPPTTESAKTLTDTPNQQSGGNGAQPKENQSTKNDGNNDNDTNHDTDRADDSNAQDAKETHLLFCGCNKWDWIGRKQVPKSVADRGGSDAGEEVLAPVVLNLTDFPGLSIRSVWSGPTAAHAVLLTSAGQAYGLGRNDNGQLGQADLCARYAPVLLPVPDGESMVSASCSRAHTLLLTKSGECLAFGSNQFGQLGIGRKHSSDPIVTTPTRVDIPQHERVISVAAAPEFSVFACRSGAVYTSGHAQNNQLGNGSTGETIAKANRVEFDTVYTPVRLVFLRPTNAPGGTAELNKRPVVITQVAAGTSHSLALDADGKVWSWGFGGYGRLGHKTPANEKHPRMIETFDMPYLKMDAVACGAASSFATQQSRSTTFHWGHIKKSSDANMYPKPMLDLYGFPLHAIQAGFSSVVAASGSSTISWGGSPTFGELGYGPDAPKSSVKPKLVDALEGLRTSCVAEGLSFTFFVVEVDPLDKEQKAVFDKLESVELSEAHNPATAPANGNDEDEDEDEEDEDEEEKSSQKRGRAKSKGKTAAAVKRKQKAAPAKTARVGRKKKRTRY